MRFYQSNRPPSPSPIDGGTGSPGQVLPNPGPRPSFMPQPAQPPTGQNRPGWSPIGAGTPGQGPLTPPSGQMPMQRPPQQPLDNFYRQPRNGGPQGPGGLGLPGRQPFGQGGAFPGQGAPVQGRFPGRGGMPQQGGMQMMPMMQNPTAPMMAGPADGGMQMMQMSQSPTAPMTASAPVDPRQASALSMALRRG